ncbi:MAG: NADH-quinone oxidoreductase subunit J [Rickettsiales bacterium]|nr:NADH-quinone oxidoreductase subunit J [Rickettsiales bacterium]
MTSLFMNFTLGFFYFFSAILIISALMVVSAKNMVHCVMFLILAFFNAAALFILLNAEFLAMLLIVVYVGAIAVLFLFVVMMLDIDSKKISKEINRHAPLLITIGAILFTEIFLITKVSTIKFYNIKSLYPIDAKQHNINAIGDLLYTDFILPFQLSGAVLFVAMIGAILLTLKKETRFIRKQKISSQTARNKANSLEIIKVKSGEGINL